jgi:hypothetical protein
VIARADNVQTKLHTKSRLEIIDLSCKATTVIGVEGDRVLKSTKDEEGNIINDSMILTGTEYTVKLSQAYSPFKYVVSQSPMPSFESLQTID